MHTLFVACLCAAVHAARLRRVRHLRQTHDIFGHAALDVGKYVDSLPLCTKHGRLPSKEEVQFWCVLEKWRPVRDYKKNLDFCPGKWQGKTPEERCFEREAQDLDFELSKCCAWGTLRGFKAKVSCKSFTFIIVFIYLL